MMRKKKGKLLPSPTQYRGFMGILFLLVGLPVQEECGETEQALLEACQDRQGPGRELGLIW